MSERDNELPPPFHGAKEATTSGTWGETAKFVQVGQGKAQQAPPDQSSNLEYDPLLEGEPVEHV